MDIFTKFWERQAVWMAKVEGIATVAAVLCIPTAIATVEKGKPFGFVVGVVGIWCFGIRMVYELWYVNERGESRIRRQGIIVRFIFSIFYGIWFVGLAIATMVLLGKINS